MGNLLQVIYVVVIYGLLSLVTGALVLIVKYILQKHQ